MPLTYCSSRFRTVRNPTREVMIGPIGIGGENPIRIQSMTITDTMDIDATAEQTIELAEAGCEIVRITAPNKRAAEALGSISQKVRQAGIQVPLVADIHFMPEAAMEAAKHVEKVRVNPGNYADRKKFSVREYTDQEYNKELERLHDSFSPLVLRCKELGRSMRIGTNHGSLSDRILNRYGDTPRGMVESALEFVRIAEDHGFRDIILSMKASNPKVMIEAYRLVVAMMKEEGMHYPLHLGVTEAGEGEDARIKSAVGIGSLLLDGLGDTIRVSLTEDPIHEIPVAKDLAAKAAALWEKASKGPVIETDEGLDPYEFNRRASREISLSQNCLVGPKQPPRVIAPTEKPISRFREITSELMGIQSKNKDAQIEGLLVRAKTNEDMGHLNDLLPSTHGVLPFVVIEDLREKVSYDSIPFPSEKSSRIVLLREFDSSQISLLKKFLYLHENLGLIPALAINPMDLNGPLGDLLESKKSIPSIITASRGNSWTHPIATYRLLAANLRKRNLDFPIWLRSRDEDRIHPNEDRDSSRLLDASIFSGALLCDGIGDLLSVENAPSLERSRTLAYNLLQGSRSRICKTEFVACPSCGRTQFDLQSTTQRVKESTGHLKGVTIAVMGCIVNGPGEMADADFGYVGTAPGKVDLYVGKDRAKSAILEEDAVDRLVELIKEEGKWIEP